MREVQDFAQKYLPNTMVNVSPVVDGLPLRRRARMCTAQVYVVTTPARKPKGLQLSRVKDQWIVGVVQQWWMQYAKPSRAKPNATCSSAIDMKEQRAVL